MTNLWHPGPKQTIARDYLVELSLDWRNNYLSIETFAEHNGLTLDEAQALLDLAYEVRNHPHPEA